MPLFNFRKFGSYQIKIVCDNCGKECSVRIKRGVSVVEAIHNKTLTCDNCGVIISPREYKTEWLT